MRLNLTRPSPNGADLSAIFKTMGAASLWTDSLQSANAAMMQRCLRQM